MNLGGSVRINPLGLAVICGIVVIIILFSRGGGSSDSPVADVPTIDTVSLRTLLSGIISAAENGGKEVKAVRSEADTGETSKGKTKEGANDPKTNGDMRSHVQMFYGIKKTFPGINIVSEEHDEAEVDESKVGALSIDDAEVMALEDKTVALADLTVWIDPLDATQEYTEKLLQYVTTMVCVAVKGVPTLGVIHKPFDGVTAWAWAGNVNKVGKAVGQKEGEGSVDLSKARIIVSRSHSGEVNSTAQAALGTGIKVTPAGGAGYKTWEVVKGVQDAYVHTTLIKKWDICAGDALLRALGGKQTDLKGQEIDYSSAEAAKNEGGLLATMHDHDKFLEKLKSLKS